MPVAPDGSGGVYVGGSTFGSLGGSNAGASDAWLARYDSLGNQLRILQFGTSTYGLCIGRGVGRLGRGVRWGLHHW